MGLDLTSPQVIGAEFTDRLSEQLLPQPDPAYLFARMLTSARAALGASAMDPGGFDLARLQALDGRLLSGTGPGANLLEAMSQGMGGMDLTAAFQFPDMVRMVKEAAMPGEVIKMNRPAYINGDTTASKRTASPTTKLFGTNSQAVLMEQVAVTIVEYLGPTNSGGTIAPISLPRFTMHRSAHDLILDVGAQLRRDWNRFLDDKMMTDVIAAATALTNGITRPPGMTSNSTYTTADNEPMDIDLLVDAGKALKDRFIPGIGGGPRYLGILPTNQIAQIKKSPNYQRLSVFEPQYSPLFPGYVRTIDTIIVCESNRMPTLASQGVGSNVTLYQGIVMAPGLYGWASADDVRALRNPNDDGGRSNEFGWSAYSGFTMLDDRYGQLIITD